MYGTINYMCSQIIFIFYFYFCYFFCYLVHFFWRTPKASSLTVSPRQPQPKYPAPPVQSPRIQSTHIDTWSPKRKLRSSKTKKRKISPKECVSTWEPGPSRIEMSGPPTRSFYSHIGLKPGACHNHLLNPVNVQGESTHSRTKCRETLTRNIPSQNPPQ